VPINSVGSTSALLLHIWPVADGTKLSVGWLHINVDSCCARSDSGKPSSQLAEERLFSGFL